MRRRPNILWICTDQQRADTIHALGNEHIRTPNLDRLVYEGVAFTKAYCQNPLCSPSRASFLTGRYPRTTRVRQNGQRYFPTDELLVTRVLAEAGYRCGLVGKLHLSAACGRVEPRPDDGYSVYHWSHHPHPNPEWKGVHGYSAWLASKGLRWEELYHPGGEIPEVFPGVPEEVHHTTWCIEKAMEFIAESGDSPWLLSVNLFDPHHPFDPPEEYLRRYDPDDLPDPKYRPGELELKPFPQRVDHQGAYGGRGISFVRLTPRQRRQVTAAYYGMIELIDTQLGRLLGFLEERGQRENTFIIFMSDHGEMLGDHGIYLKGPHFYEPAVRVPLIFSWPEVFSTNLQVDAFVELIDLVPTLYECLGLSIPPGVQGRSLRALCEGDMKGHRESVYCEYYNSHVLYNGQRVYATMLREGDWKIVVYHGLEEGELYNLSRDPDEYENLWWETSTREKRAELLKKCFDRSVFTMDPLPERVALW